MTSLQAGIRRLSGSTARLLYVPKVGSPDLTDASLVLVDRDGTEQLRSPRLLRPYRARPSVVA